MALAGAASAAPSGVVTISGTTQSKIELTLADDTASFGTTMTPDGDPSGGESTLAGTAAAGACYAWAGTATVRSNVTYRVGVNGSGSLSRVGFLTAAPATYAACTGGMAVSTAMFPAAVPPTAFVINQTATTSRAHNFWLGLSVGWTDPTGNINPAPAVSLTLTAAVYP
ncbi:MAG: hypothetical protein U0667_01410 [Chloroflexota bacterium]